VWGLIPIKSGHRFKSHEEGLRVSAICEGIPINFHLNEHCKDAFIIDSVNDLYVQLDLKLE
jgi:hypothetical protein